jgi:hypothetical protein
MSTHTHDAARVAAQYAAEISALRAYLARTGFRPEVVDPAVAEAIANLVNRPDISRPMAYLSTIARGEAERLTAELRAKGDQGLTAPDLMKAMQTTGPRRRPTAPRRQRGRARQQASQD